MKKVDVNARLREVEETMESKRLPKLYGMPS